jgi:DNA polymerase-3 subunit delta'
VKVFDHIIGQDQAVQEVSKNIAASRVGNEHGALAHAWLITGAPGSGRSTLALAMAAALTCPNGGCGTCLDCSNAMAGIHVDVEHIVPDGVLYKVDNARELIKRSALAPVSGPWHIFVIEDIDRFRHDAASTLLKSLEEPPPRTIWLLCAPTPEDVYDTIRSRCRALHLNTPTTAEVAEQLISRHRIDPAMAHFVARVSQGHIGRARLLATDEDARLRRNQVISIPGSLKNIGSCIALANSLVDTADKNADAVLEPIREQGLANIKLALGETSDAKLARQLDRSLAKATKDLEEQLKARKRRVKSDEFDRVLIDLTSFYRDVLVLQSGSTAGLINEEIRNQIQSTADSSTPSQTLSRIAAIDETRDHLFANVTPQLAFEAMLVRLMKPLETTTSNH